MTIMPVGSIVAFGGTRKPDGWLWCDGSTIPSGTDYSDLRKILGQNKTPDLRGYFLRGLDTSRQIDPGVSKGRSKRLAGRTLLSTQGMPSARMLTTTSMLIIREPANPAPAIRPAFRPSNMPAPGHRCRQPTSATKTGRSMSR